MNRSKAARTAALLLGLVLATWAAGEAAAQTTKPPPRPKAEAETQTQPAPVARPKRPVDTGPVAPPKPVLLISSDMDCRVEMDGTELGTLVKDVVSEFPVRAGDHLMQAFPLGIEGPVWKHTLKAPETGKVVATVELKELVADWEEEMQNVDRFQVDGSIVTDSDTGLAWMKNVSPRMRWEDVQAYCAGKKEGGGGWRLPTLDELSKLHFPDHPQPRQETDRGDTKWTILGKRKGEMTVQPRLIFEPFDHNSVAALWVMDQEPRTACSFLGEFTCVIERKKSEATTLCVKSIRQSP